MKTVLTPEQMSRCDAFSIGALTANGESPYLFMERAAEACVSTLMELFPDKKRVLVLAGNGANGGDGIAAARLLEERGVRAEVCMPDPDARRSAACEEQIRRAEEAEVRFRPYETLDFSRYDLLVDALFGTGLSRPLDGVFAETVRRMNESGLPVLAVDIPSGVDGRNGQCPGGAVRAEVTVTMQYPKPGLYLYPGADFVGTLRTADLGIGGEAVAEEPVLQALEEDDIPRLLPKRAKNGNKGTFGRVLIAAGSEDMSGAAFFSAKAAYRCGAGLVRILTPGENRVILAEKLPEALITTYDARHPDLGVFQSAAAWADVCVLGPGIGTGEGAVRMAQSVLDTLAKKERCPLILDADALNLLAMGKIAVPAGIPVIYTPHPGELSRLSGISVPELLSDLPVQAREYAKKLPSGAVLIAKDARTVTTDGEQAYLNLSGCSALAKGGSGDVLTGILAALCASGCAPMDAAALGVYLHGRAGELLARDWGVRGVMASELPDAAAVLLKDLD